MDNKFGWVKFKEFSILKIPFLEKHPLNICDTIWLASILVGGTLLCVFALRLSFGVECATAWKNMHKNRENSVFQFGVAQFFCFNSNAVLSRPQFKFYRSTECFVLFSFLWTEIRQTYLWKPYILNDKWILLRLDVCVRMHTAHYASYIYPIQFGKTLHP